MRENREKLNVDIVMHRYHSAARLGKNKGTVIAFNNMAVVISGALFQPLIGKTLQLFHPASAAQVIYDASALKKSLIVIILCYLIGTVIASLFIKETYR